MIGLLIGLAMISPWLPVAVSILTAASLMALLGGSIVGGRGRILAAVGMTFVLVEAGAGFYITTKVQEHDRASRERPLGATFGPEEYKRLRQTVDS